MSDALNPFWDYYVCVLAIVSILACAIFLNAQSRGRKPPTTTETTGHTWDDDLTELNNPLPRWWMWLFYITIGFALVYLLLYPGTALYGGVLGWSSKGQLKEEVAAGDAKSAPLYAQFRQTDTKILAYDPAAHAMGERLFQNNCSQCHGSDARGSRGFPNLTDDDWLHGGDPAAIEETIMDGRHGLMPPMGAAIGGDEAVLDVANYVLSLSGSAHDAARAALGKEKFAVCAACHGADGKGNIAVGAPNLTDQIWLYGGDLKTIVATITRGREGVMPAHRETLGTDRVHVLAAYVWSLSHPAPAPVAQGGPPPR